MLEESHDVETPHRWGLITAEDVRDYKFARIYDDVFIRRCKRPGYDQACYMVGHEMTMTLSDEEKHALSDLFGGATNNKAVDSWGHFPDKKTKEPYWDNAGNKLAAEAFAGMFAGSISSPKAMAKLEEYLPESCKMFRRMLKEMVKHA